MDASARTDAARPSADAARATYTARTCVGRSTFIAGFAYKEITRYGSARGHDGAYVTLMTLAFAAGTLAVALGSFVLFYLERARTARGKDAFIDRVNDTYVRGAFRAFLLSLLFYMLGIGRSGFAHFPSSPWRYLPFVASLLATCALIAGVVAVVRSQLQLQHTRGVSGVARVDGRAWLEEAARQDPRNVLRSGQPFHAFLLRQADELAGRATYVLGFSQAGAVRFVPTGSVAGNGFLVAMVLALVCAALPAFVLSVVAIFLHDTEPDQKPALAARLHGLCKLMFLSYLAALPALALAVALMAWGVGFPDEFAAPLGVGLGTLALLLGGLVAVARTHAGVAAAPVPRATAAGGAAEAAAQALVERELAQVNTTGAQATISSGFAFFSAVTFASDVLARSRSRGLSRAHLAVQCITFAGGLVAATFDSLLTVFTNDLQLQVQRAALLTALRPLARLCVAAFQLSLLGFLAGFALFGVVKYDPVSYLPASAAAAAIALIVAGAAYLRAVRLRVHAQLAAAADADEPQGEAGAVVRPPAAATSSGTGAATAAPSTTKPRPSLRTSARFSVRSLGDPEASSEEYAARVDRRRRRLAMASQRAMFFGGFAYVAVNALSTFGRPAAYPYLACMAAAFALSVTVVMLAAVYAVNLALCASPLAKRVFMERSNPLYVASLGCAVTAMLAFLAGFALVGYVKSIATYRDYSGIMLAGALLIVPALLALLLRLASAQRAALDPAVQVRVPATFSHARVAGQVDIMSTQAAFVAGNAFFELLFSAAGSTRAVNSLYFAATSATFATGATLVIVATSAAFLLARLRREHDRQRFGFLAKRTKTALFALNVACLVAWLASLTVLGRVKYDARHGPLWEPALVLGLLALALLAVALRRIKAASDCVVREEEGKDGGGGSSRALSTSSLELPLLKSEGGDRA